MVRDFVFRNLLPSPMLLTAAGAMLYVYQVSGLQKVLRVAGVMKLLGPLGDREALAPSAQIPFFFRRIGQTFPAEGERRYRVAMMAGCIANISFSRLNEATVRVLQKNGCEVVIPVGQTCCGALHVHAGIRDQARTLARQNIDAVLGHAATSRVPHMPLLRKMQTSALARVFDDGLPQVFDEYQPPLAFCRYLHEFFQSELRGIVGTGAG
jgi:Fe-S oxidoreductase